MRSLMFRICGLIFILLVSLQSFSQERCATVEFLQRLKDKNLLQSENSFEQWLKQKTEEKSMLLETEGATLSIPVVVHVIHKGESIATGTNISDEQIRSQIRVLNNDFNRLNNDTVNTPSEFSAVTGKISVEFMLAKQTPDGLSTNGIVRVKGTRNQWSVNDDEVLKSLSYWPAEDYLNIWVTDLTSSYLGYAQFPVSNLPGLGGASDSRLTDGVVIDYMAFGSIDDGNFNLHSGFRKGRTTTHEVGHFFGLRHIWGDDNGSCNGNGDYVADTPDQADQTNGCPSHPNISCSQPSMFQNYMDYTNDICMNLFTKGQISRMETVLKNSPRRASLSSSPGLTDPLPVANDLGVVDIVSPQASVCSTAIIPMLKVRNNGTNPITRSTLTITLNNVLIETQTFTFDPALEISQTSVISFNAVQIEPGTHNLAVSIISTNDDEDGKPYDNQKNRVTHLPDQIALPFKETFDNIPASWRVENPDEKNTWTTRSAPHASSSNNAIHLNFYQYNYNAGETDRLVTPLFDLSEATSPFLIFDVAYARYQNSNDGLKIYVLSDCSSEETEIYARYGNALATAPASNTAFVPVGETQWNREVVDLQKFIQHGGVQLAFEGINGGGNNLYLDNITVVGNRFESMIIKKANHLSPVHCSYDVEPSLVIENNGGVAITSFNIRYSINGGIMQTVSFSEGIDLEPGDAMDITLPNLYLSDGENTILFEARELNGLVDNNPEDNLTVKTVVNLSTDKIPLRQNFNDLSWVGAWSAVNPSGGMSWEAANTSFNQSMYFNAYNNSAIGDEAWLVSPTLDFSNASTASVFFDLSYRNKDSAMDRFKVLASRDCGANFDEVLYDKIGDSIMDTRDNNPWVPTDMADWKQVFLNLNMLAGEKQARLAFVFTNANGNNFYLDNIEFFVSDNPSPSVPDNLYSIYGNHPEGFAELYITFNLESRQAVQYELVDMLGRQIASSQLPDVLNQTYRIETNAVSKGIYIVRLLINKKYYATKVYLGG